MPTEQDQNVASGHQDAALPSTNATIERDEQVRTHGTAAAVLMAMVAAIEIVAAQVFMGDPATGDPDTDFMLQQGALLVGGLSIVVALWLAAVIWQRAALWACAVVASLSGISALFALSDFLANSSRFGGFWVLAYAAPMLIAGDAILAGLRRSRPHSAAPAAAKSSLSPAGDPTVQREAPSSLSEAWRTGVRETRGLRRFIRGVGLASLLVALGLGLYFWGKSEGFTDGATSPPMVQPAEPASSGPLVAGEQLLANGQPPPALQQVVPASELEDMTNAPNPATVEAIISQTRELCRLQGTDERAITFAELSEMANSKTAAYEAAGRRGFQRSADDEQCYRDAKEIQRQVAEEQEAGAADGEFQEAPQ